MKTRNKKMEISTLALAVAAALTYVPAYADDDSDAAALKLPTNYVELGAADVSHSSAKFGEYTGLNKSGGYLLGNLGIRGGDAYSQNESGGTHRWSLSGTDLGLTSRSASATIADQGKWNLGLGYDQLTHNLSDSYQTPYQGNMGGNRFVLPSTFSTTSNTNTLTPAQLGAFHTVDVNSERQNLSVKGGAAISQHLDFNFDYNHLNQTGAKLMGFGSALNGATTNEFISVLPMPTDYRTDTLNMGVTWKGTHGLLTGAYSGSFFHDNNSNISFETYAGANSMQIVGTPPSSNANQLSLAGNYAFSKTTKLTSNVSYGRVTQNDPFSYDSFLMITPSSTSSLNGVLVNSHADVKLSNQTTKDLTLYGSFKFDQRDNRTTSNMYNFHAIDGAAVANYPNTPLSNNKSQYELAGEYRLTANQHLRLAYDHEDVSRWCDHYAVGTGYPSGTQCVVAGSSREDRIDSSYKLKVSDGLTTNLGYSYSRRTTDSDAKAIASISGADAGAPGVNAGDFVGFYPFFDATRTEQKFKGGFNWQATDSLTLGLGARFTEDSYVDSTYGLQNSNSSAVNLDASYSYSDSGSVSTFLTVQHQQNTLHNQQNANAVVATATKISVPADSSWDNTLMDDGVTVGVGFKQTGLFDGKLNLGGDASYSYGNSGYNTQLNYSGTTTGGLTCSAPNIHSCGQLPGIRNETFQLKLTGAYQINKSSKLEVKYVFQAYNSNDYYYNGLQTGETPTALMPTNQQAGNYSVNAMGLAYLYNF